MIMLSQTFNGDMLELARGARELTQAEAARASGITQAMFSKIENRLVEPSQEVVAAIAAALDYPVEFFYQNERAFAFPHFHHRKRSKLNARPLAKIHALINIQRQHITRLLKAHNNEPAKPIPEFDLKQRYRSPAEIARMMREYWMLPRGPIEDLTSTIEAAGGIVIQCEFGTTLLDAISFRAPGLPPLFFMNRDVPSDRYRFTLAHELGHMIMHSHPDDDEEMESAADQFAANFLMPASDVRPYLTDLSFGKLARVKGYWRVSIKALIRRCYDLKMMTTWQYKNLSIQYNKAGYMRGEPNPLPAEKPGALSKLVAFHMRQLGFSAADLAKLLYLNEGEFRRLYDPPSHGTLQLVVSN